MVVGGSNDGGSSATDPRVSKRDYNRDTSRSNAIRRGAEQPFTAREFVTTARPDNYMRDLGREGVQRQQEAMSQAADDEDARVQRRQPTRVVKRTPPRAAGRK